MPLPIIPYLLESGPTEPVSLLRRQLTEPFPVHGHDYFELELVVSGSPGVQLGVSVQPGEHV